MQGGKDLFRWEVAILVWFRKMKIKDGEKVI